MTTISKDYIGKAAKLSDVSPVQRWAIFAAMILTIFSLGYNTIATTNAMISIRDQMNLDAAQMQWTMNAYILPAASLTVLMGMLSDHFGKRNLVIITLLLFLLGCLLTAIAKTPLMFIVGRLFQGVSAACLMPVSLAILKIVFPEDKQSIVTTSWSVATALAMMLGPFLSGYIVPYMGWPYIYWISFILSFLALVLLVIASHKHLSNDQTVQFDLRGLFTFVIGVVIFVYALVEGGSRGWGSTEIITLLCVSIGLLLIQPFVEHFVKGAPFIDYKFFLDKDFSMGCIAFFIEGYLLFGIFFFFNIVAQNKLLMNFSPAIAGCALLPLGISFVITSVLGTRIIAKLGKLYSGCTMMGLFLIGFVWFSICGANAHYSLVWEPLAFIGLASGLGIKFGALLAVSDFSVANVGRASGIAGYHLYIGAIFGTSLGVVLYLLVQPNLVKILAEHYHVFGVSTKILQNSILGHSSAMDTILAMSKDKMGITHVIKQASINGFLYTTIGGSILSVIGLISACLLLGGRPKHEN